MRAKYETTLVMTQRQTYTKNGLEMLFILLVLIINTALLTGNEFAVAAFIHPALSRENHQQNLLAIQCFARLYGNIMPIWMALTSGLHGLASIWAWFYASQTFPWFLAATLIWAIVIPFSLIFPVPLNNQVKAWDLNRLPSDWEAIRRRWDFYNWMRAILLVAAFVLLLIGFQAY
jgi:uncharacterized membrane protein